MKATMNPDSVILGRHALYECTDDMAFAQSTEARPVNLGNEVEPNGLEPSISRVQFSPDVVRFAQSRYARTRACATGRRLK